MPINDFKTLNKIYRSCNETSISLLAVKYALVNNNLLVLITVNKQRIYVVTLMQATWHLKQYSDKIMSTKNYSNKNKIYICLNNFNMYYTV